MLDFEQQLVLRQTQICGWINALSRAAVVHGVAGASGSLTDPQEWARLADLEERALTELRAVEQALDRLRHGSFGLCKRCGEPISFLRLEREPWVTVCAGCALVR